VPDDRRIALITGSTSGIGLAIAKRLVQAGNAVALNSFEADADAALAEVGAAGPGTVRYFSADLSRPETGYDLVQQVVAAFGQLDVLVNNAGVQKVASIEAFPPADWDRIRAISLDSAFHTIRAAVPGMVERGWGRIINVASAHGLRASPFKSAYGDQARGRGADQNGGAGARRKGYNGQRDLPRLCLDAARCGPGRRSGKGS